MIDAISFIFDSNSSSCCDKANVKETVIAIIHGYIPELLVGSFRDTNCTERIVCEQINIEILNIVNPIDAR